MRPKKRTALVFNENSRREFVTGFHRRKLERKKHLKQKFDEQLKEAKKLIKTQARETFKKFLYPLQPLPNNAILEDQYELPHHYVKVQEISNDSIVEQNNWIGPNKGSISVQKVTLEGQMNSESRHTDKINEMPLNSVKEMKKIIDQQSRTLMQCNKAFKKKNRLEKLKSRKQAARKKRALERERKKLKGRKRK